MNVMDSWVGRGAEPLGVAASRRLREARLRRQCGWKWSYVGKDDSNGLVVGGWVRSHWEWRRPAAFAKRGYVGYYYNMEHETAASE